MGTASSKTLLVFVISRNYTAEHFFANLLLEIENSPSTLFF